MCKARLARYVTTREASRNAMLASARSAGDTQEIQVEDILEMHVVADAEDLVSTRVQSRATSMVTATLRVASLTHAQAMSALSTPASGRQTSDPAARTGAYRVLSRSFGGQLPAPIWASISAAVAALVVGSAALAASHGSDDSVSIQVRVAEREEPQNATKAMRRKYVTSEQLGRWSEVPTFVPEVSDAQLSKR